MLQKSIRLVRRGATTGKSLGIFFLLWMLGVPAGILILLWIFGVGR